MGEHNDNSSPLEENSLPLAVLLYTRPPSSPFPSPYLALLQVMSMYAIVAGRVDVSQPPSAAAVAVAGGKSALFSTHITRYQYPPPHPLSWHGGLMR